MEETSPAILNPHAILSQPMVMPTFPTQQHIYLNIQLSLLLQQYPAIPFPILSYKLSLQLVLIKEPSKNNLNISHSGNSLLGSLPNFYLQILPNFQSQQPFFLCLAWTSKLQLTTLQSNQFLPSKSLIPAKRNEVWPNIAVWILSHLVQNLVSLLTTAPTPSRWPLIHPQIAAISINLSTPEILKPTYFWFPLTTLVKPWKRPFSKILIIFLFECAWLFPMTALCALPRKFQSILLITRKFPTSTETDSPKSKSSLPTNQLHTQHSTLVASCYSSDKTYIISTNSEQIASQSLPTLENPAISSELYKLFSISNNHPVSVPCQEPCTGFLSSTHFGLCLNTTQFRGFSPQKEPLSTHIPQDVPSLPSALPSGSDRRRNAPHCYLPWMGLLGPAQFGLYPSSSNHSPRAGFPESSDIGSFTTSLPLIPSNSKNFLKARAPGSGAAHN